MKIIAFLQNPWSPGLASDPEKLRQFQKLYEMEDYWRDFLRMSKSGRRLETAFKELYEVIIWRNANPTPADTSSEVKPYDVAYIRGLIIEHRPDVVLCFGKQAEAGVAVVLHNMPQAVKHVINCCHPSPRLGPDGFAKVVIAAGQLRKLLPL